MGWLADETGLEKNAANYSQLTPLSHLRRANMLFPDYTALVDRGIRRTYAEYYERATRLASALVNLGVKPGDVVATLLPNTAPHAEAHWGVPATGAILNAINTRLDVDTVTFILGHGEAKVLLVDGSLVSLAEKAIADLEGPAPILIEVPDEQAGIMATGKYQTYEDLVASGPTPVRWDRGRSDRPPTRSVRR